MEGEERRDVASLWDGENERKRSSEAAAEIAEEEEEEEEEEPLLPSFLPTPNAAEIGPGSSLIFGGLDCGCGCAVQWVADKS